MDAILGVRVTFLCYDLPWAIAALRNIVEIVSEEDSEQRSPAGVWESRSSGRRRSRRRTWRLQAFREDDALLGERYRDEAQGNSDARLSTARCSSRRTPPASRS